MEKFIELFCKKTKELSKTYCEREMDVSLGDLNELISKATELGFIHCPKYFETHQNQPFQITPKNYKDLENPATMGNFLQKVINAFQPQAAKHVTAHFFDGRNGEWHCFYWVGADIQGAEGGKVWGNISHIHYTSHLFNTSRADCELRISAKGARGIDKAHLKMVVKND